MARHKFGADIKKINRIPFLSQDEKDAKIDALISRKKLIPKKQREKITDFVNWPEVHAEMDLTELFAARVSLMKILKFIKPGHSIHKFVGLLKDADAACSDAWATATVLRSLVASVPEVSSYEPGLPHQLERCTILNMERAVENLTCVLLNPNYLESLRHKSTYNNQHRLTVGRVQKYTKDVKSWKCIGSMLTKEINEGNMQFVRGVLETLEARSISEKDQEITNQKSYLAHKEALMQIMEGQKSTDTAMRGSDQGATPIPPVIGKRSRQPPPHHQDTAHPTTPKSKRDDKTLTGPFPDSSRNELAPGEIQGSQPSKRLKYNRDMASSDYPAPSPIPTNSGSHVPSRRSKRFHPTPSHTSVTTPHGPRNTEAETHEDSESTTDEDDPAEMQELLEISKSMYNPHQRLVFKPESQISDLETPSMEGFRVAIEAVKLAEDTSTGPNGGQDGENAATRDEMSDHCDKFQSAVRIFEDNSDEGIGSEDFVPECKPENNLEDGVRPIPVIAPPA